MIGYRTEDIWGSGIRDLGAIVLFEINELGNDVDSYIGADRAIAHGYVNGVWVCRSPEQVYESYEPLHGETYQIDKYIFTDYIVICDLDCDGKLIAYKDCEVIESVKTGEC